MRLKCLAQTEYDLGKWDDSVLHAVQATSLAEDSDQVWMLGFTNAVAALPLAARGDWVSAAAYVNAASEFARLLDDQVSLNFAQNATVHLAIGQGDPWRGRHCCRANGRLTI